MQLNPEEVATAITVVSFLYGIILKIFFSPLSEKVKALEERMKENEQTIAAHREISAEKYVTRVEIEGKLDKLEKLMYRLLRLKGASEEE